MEGNGTMKESFWKSLKEFEKVGKVYFHFERGKIYLFLNDHPISIGETVEEAITRAIEANESKKNI